MEFNGKVTHKTKKELVGKTISKTKYQVAEAADSIDKEHANV